MHVRCPACGALLRCEDRDAGQEAICPACKAHYEMRRPSEGVTAERPAAPAGENVLDALLEMVTSAAAPPSHEVDPWGHFDPHVEDAAEAEEELRRWQHEMPKVPSAYQPSGALPARAVVLMAVGAVVGSGAGALAALLVAGVGGAVVAALYSVVALIVFCGFVWWLAIVLVGVLGVLVGVGTFAAAGWVAAWFTTLLGRWGHNRNVRAAALLSVLSGVASVAVLGLLFWSFGRPVLAARQAVGRYDLLAFALVAVGGAIAAVTAGFTAVERVRSAKFCENCQRPMTRRRLRSLSLADLRAVTRALARGELGGVAESLHGPAGEEGQVELFACPSCSRGYLEVTARFRAEWREEQDRKSRKESWLAASRELSERDVDKLLSVVADEAKGPLPG